MKQIGLPVIGVPAGDTSAIEGKMLSALARLAALEGKMSTLEGKMSTLEGKMSTLEGKVGAFQDALNLAPMILYNAEGAGDAVVKVLASSDDTEKVSFEYAVVADYKPGSQDSYRFSRATYTGATTTREGVFISVPAGSSLLVRSLTAATWASGIGKYNKFKITSGKFTLDGDVTALVGWKQTDKTIFCSLFEGCTGLAECTPGVLPATTLAAMCYSSMFYGCTSLTTAPVLPATTLAAMCYSSMFSGCTSLTTAPVLPATTLATSCYYSMFSGCTSLTYIKAMFKGLSTSALAPTANWVKGVAAEGTYVKNAEATYTSTGDSAIPEGWTVETATE